MSPQLPDHTIDGDKKVFDITNNDMDQIIFNIEGDIKDIITYLAKQPNNRYGNTSTAVLHQWIIDGLENHHNITFSTATKTIKGSVREYTELEKMNSLKKLVRTLKKEADFGYYQADLQDGRISVDSVNSKIMEANKLLYELTKEGYDIEALASTKKAFSTKWQGSSWMYEISRKTDIEEEVKQGGTIITRFKANPEDRHYLQYNDNGITLICPNIFDNAFYLKYGEVDEYFNRELRKVSAQHLEYKRDDTDSRTEWLSVVDEFCPQGKTEEAKKYIKDKNNECIGIHLVKLERKNKRKCRYMCIDIWNKHTDDYKQIVFMTNRGYGTEDTTEDFYQLFQKVLGKKDKPKPIKKAGVKQVGFTSDTSSSNVPVGIALTHD